MKTSKILAEIRAKKLMLKEDNYCGKIEGWCALWYVTTICARTFLCYCFLSFVFLFDNNELNWNVLFAVFCEKVWWTIGQRNRYREKWLNFWRKSLKEFRFFWKFTNHTHNLTRFLLNDNSLFMLPKLSKKLSRN